MPKSLVDVFDRDGAKLFTYTIVLEEEGCIEAEFEEVALIFAERSGLVAAEEIPHLTARCEGVVAAPPEQAVRPVHAKGNVLSLIKHRMKKAASTSAAAHAKRHA